MATTAEDYLVAEGTKYLGKSLEAIDEVKEQMEKIDFAYIAENNPDQLASAHEGMKVFHDGMSMQLMVMMILAILSTPKEADNA